MPFGTMSLADLAMESVIPVLRFNAAKPRSAVLVTAPEKAKVSSWLIICKTCDGVLSGRSTTALACIGIATATATITAGTTRAGNHFLDIRDILKPFNHEQALC